MEEALLVRFLNSMILFSSTSNFFKLLKKEIYLCHKYMKLSMDEIYNMPVMDRKNFIHIHNEEVKKESAAYK